jgi:hypothetical protein
VKLEGVAPICELVSILALANEGPANLRVLRRRRRRMNARTPIAVNKIARPPTMAPAISPACDIFDDSDVLVVCVALPFIGRTGALNKELGQSQGKRAVLHELSSQWRKHGALRRAIE